MITGIAEINMNLNNTIRTAIRRNARWLLRLMALIFLVIGQDIQAKEKPIPLLELTDSIFSQPNFTIKIYENGKVHYSGYKLNNDAYSQAGQHVGVIGDRYAQLTKKQLNELIEAYESLPFDGLKKLEELRGNTVRSTYIHFRRGNEAMDINVYPFFLKLTTKLNKFININKWVCYPKGHPEHDRCLINDMPDNFDYRFFEHDFN